MKTAISVPDDTFERAERRAAQLRMTRSEFFATAAQRYLDELDAVSVTGQINSVLEQWAQPDDSAADAVGVGRALLDGSDEAW